MKSTVTASSSAASSCCLCGGGASRTKEVMPSKLEASSPLRTSSERNLVYFSARPALNSLGSRAAQVPSALARAQLAQVGRTGTHDNDRTAGAQHTAELLPR